MHDIEELERLDKTATPGPVHANGNGVHQRRGTVGMCVAIGYDPDNPGHCTEVSKANAELIAWLFTHRKSLIAAYRERQWRDIESAPHNGSRVLIIDTASRCRVAEFINGRWRSVPGEYAVKPTHWQPLPSPPEGKGT